MTEPVQPEPAQPEPVETEPAQPEPVADAPVPPVKRQRAGAPWLVVLLSLAFGLLCLAAAAAYVLSDRSSGTGSDDAVAVRSSAVEAARERTVALTSYDYRRLDADTAGVLETATGAFEQEYTKTVEQLRETFETSQAVATSTVLAVGLEGEVESTDAGERAVAVVAVDQVIATKGAQPRTERNRLRMTLVRPESTWLVEAVERL